MDEARRFRVAETFDSIQGEGFWSGVRMFFIRLAGCSVGRPITKESPYEECTLYDGRKFVCDTNYRLTASRTLTELLAMIPRGVEHVSITGGEPFNQPLIPLVEHITDRDIMVHIETSGTVRPDWFDYLQNMNNVWITCSPKKGFYEDVVREANELKILVNLDFEFEKVPQCVLDHKLVYVSGVNLTTTLSSIHAREALKVVMQHRPDWRITTQAHKLWGVR